VNIKKAMDDYRNAILILYNFLRALFYERYSKRRGGKKAVVAVAHEMIRICYFMLKRNEAYRGENRGMTERKLKSMERRALNGLRN